VTAFHLFLLSNGFYFALPNPEAYAVAKATASYRERGLTHEQALSEIRERIGDWAIPFADMRVIAKMEPAFRPLYTGAMVSRTAIRNDHRNTLVASV